jgi:polyphenol oxidase
MRKTSINGLHLWQFENLNRFPELRHYVSERNTVDTKEDFSLSLSSTSDKDSIRKNRRLLASALQITDSRLYFPSQVHETKIVRVTQHTTQKDLRNTDALMTNENGICISVMSADCVTILLYDPVNKAVAAIHSGWRGTVARILEKTLKELHNAFGSEGENIIAAIGPSVCQDSYEVGEEVIHEVERSFGPECGLLLSQSPGKAKLDLWAANKIQLLDFGVNLQNIEVSNLCTIKENRHFFSARKGDKGRFAAGIMLI